MHLLRLSIFVTYMAFNVASSFLSVYAAGFATDALGIPRELAASLPITLNLIFVGNHFPVLRGAAAEVFLPRRGCRQRPHQHGGRQPSVFKPQLLAAGAGPDPERYRHGPYHQFHQYVYRWIGG